MLWRLYRRERRELSRAEAGLSGRPAMLVVRRGRGHAGRAGPGLEPHARRSGRTCRSSSTTPRACGSPTLTPTNRARPQVAAALQLRSRRRAVAGGPAPRTPRLDLVKASLVPSRQAGAGREVFIYDLESASRDRRINRGPVSSTRSSRSGRLPPGRCAPGVLALHGPAGRRYRAGTDGRSNAGEDPLRAADAATRQGIPVYPDRRRGRGGAAERPARRDRGKPGRLRPRPDDAGRRRRGPRPARTPRERSTWNSASTAATGRQSAISGWRWAKTAS